MGILVCSAFLILLYIDGESKFFKKTWHNYVIESINYQKYSKILFIAVVLIVVIHLILSIARISNGRSKKVNAIVKSKNFEDYAETKKKISN